MELLELLTSIETNNIDEITLEGVDVKPLSDFIIEYQISYSTLDEANNDLEQMKANELNSYYIERSSDDITESIEQDFDEIILEFGEIVYQEVYVIKHEIEDGKINIRLT